MPPKKATHSRLINLINITGDKAATGIENSLLNLAKHALNAHAIDDIPDPKEALSLLQRLMSSPEQAFVDELYAAPFPVESLKDAADLRNCKALNETILSNCRAFAEEQNCKRLMPHILMHSLYFPQVMPHARLQQR